MHKSVFFVSLFLLSLFVLSPVFAQIDVVTYPTADGFSVFASDAAVELCQGAFFVDSFFITNTGAFASRYGVSHDATNFLTLSDASFDILPGRSEEVFVYVQAPLDSTFDEFVSFEIVDIFGNTHSFQRRIVVNECSNLQASLVTKSNASIGPCQPVSYEVFVTNTGAYEETYQVVFGGKSYAEYFDKPYQSITIPAGLSGSVNASLALACGVSGSVQVPFSVESTTSDLVADLAHVLEIEPRYGFSLDFVAPEKLCAFDDSLIPVTITNDAAFENTFVLSLDAPSFVNLSQGNVTIPAFAEATVFVKVAPDADAVGLLPVSLSVKGVIGGVHQSVSTNVSVDSCFDVLTSIDMQDDIFDCAGPRSYPVTVQNTGSEDVEFVLSVNGSHYARISPSYGVLEPGDVLAAEILLEVPPGVAHEASLTVSAEVLDVPVSASDTIRVQMVDEYACFAPSLVDEKIRVPYSAGTVDFVVEHVGLAPKDFDVSLESSSFFALNGSASLVSLVPGDKESLRLLMYQSDEPVRSLYNIAFVFSTASVDGLRTLSYTLPAQVDLRAKNPFLIAYEFVLVNPCEFVLLLLLTFIVVSLLYFLFVARPLRSGFSLLLGLLLVWIIAAGVFVLVNGMPAPLYEPVKQVPEDPALIRMAEDTTYTLNASAYFVDPDQDILSYTVPPIDNVSVFVDGDLITFTPQEDFFGTRRFRIIADDAFGGVTESPRFYLEVVDRPEYDVFLFIDRYCGYLNLALLFFVALIIFVFAKRYHPLDDRKTPKPVAGTMVVSKSSAASLGSSASVVSKKKSVKKKSAAKKSAKKKSVKKKSTKKSSWE